MGCDIKKTESDYYVILFFSVITLVFNIYLLFLKCVHLYPDKLILILSLITTIVLVIFIPVKVIQSKDDNLQPYVNDILDISHWGYVVVVPLGILLSRSVPLIIFFLNVSWFAILGRAIYEYCPLSSIAGKSTQFNLEDSFVNLFFVMCVLIGVIRIIIN